MVNFGTGLPKVGNKVRIPVLTACIQHRIESPSQCDTNGINMRKDEVKCF